MSKSSDKREVKIMTVSPELAAKFLENNHRNRPMRHSRVLEYANTMKNGEWHLTPEPIVFCDAYKDERTGKEWGETLMEGQHRLQAVIESGVTCEFTVWFHCDPAEFEVMGQGKTRSQKDILVITRGDTLPYAPICASVCTGFILRALGYNLAIDAWMIRRLLDRNEADIVSVAKFKVALKGLADRELLAALLLAQFAAPEAVEPLINKIRHGLEFKGDRDPARLLHHYIFSRKMGLNREPHDVHFLRLCSGIALYLSNGTASKLRLDPWGLEWLRTAGKKKLDPIVKDIFGRTPTNFYTPQLNERQKELARQDK